jgi:hypothetical protein
VSGSTSTALEVTCIKVGVEGATASGSTSTAVNSHALAATMATTTATVGALSNGSFESVGSSSLVLFVGPVDGGGAGAGELEVVGRSLLLGNLSGLLGIGQSQRVSSLVTATGTTASAATSTTSVLSAVSLWGLEVAEAGSR